MLSILKGIKDRAPQEHEYFGRGNDERMRQLLADLPAGADDLDRFRLLGELGFVELIYQPTPQRGIQRLTEAYELIPKTKFPDKTSEEFLTSRIKFTLAVAYLRLGETENCCLRHSSESCILPIRGSGVHTEPQGSRQAIKYFQEVLDDTQGSANIDHIMDIREPARWLMNIAYMTLGEYPEEVPEQYRIPAKFFESEIEFPPFENVAPKLQLNTFNQAGGSVVDDFDNDDYLDIFTTTSDPTGQTRFFRNNRDGTFTERTEQAGLIGIYGGLNLVQADYDNDGNLDVYILRGAWLNEYGRQPNSLLRNIGNGKFIDVTFEAGLGEAHYPSKTAAWADYDNDGDLDLFVGNETTPTLECPSQLFRNNGDGTFTDVAAQAGVNIAEFSMGTTWGDFNDDRFPDLFVSCGNPAPGRLFRNDGGKTFTDVCQRLGMDRPASPFPVWFWDFDNDGALDLYVSNTSKGVGVLSLDAIGTHLVDSSDGRIKINTDISIGSQRKLTKEFELPGLYRGDGKGGFEEVAAEQNLSYPTEPMGANFGDLNGDGFLDFYLATGDVHYWELRPNVMFLNQGGTGFANVTMGGGFGHLQKGHGVCFADMDNDGDQDIYVQMGGQLPGDKFNDALFQNPGFGHHWLTIKLVGHKSNKSAIGARIHVTIVENGKHRSIYRHVNSGGSFGCNPLRQNIGLGKAERIELLEIYWPMSDLTQTFRDVEMDQAIQVIEGEQQYQTIKLERFVLGTQESSPVKASAAE